MYNETFISKLKNALKGLRTIHTVGEEWVSYVGSIPDGGVPYCGQEVSRETYSALWAYAQDKGLVKTESEWQSLATSNGGSVAFYSSGDGSTTFRMPKVVGYVKGATSHAEAGSYIAEGLPDVKHTHTRGTMEITGAVWNFTVSANPTSVSYQVPTTSGAFSLNDRTEGVTYGGTSVSNQFDGFKFTASNAWTGETSEENATNSIYGSSSHVTPETSVILFGVYAFGAVTNVDELDATTLATELASVKTNYLPLTGGAVTGMIERTVSGAVNNYVVEASNTTSGHSISFGIGVGQANRGIWDGATKAWMVNLNANGVLQSAGKTVVCVSSWRSGANWYRKYSDGWIEQGGYYESSSENSTLTISLNTSFSDTSYTLALGSQVDTSWIKGSGAGWTSKTTTTFSYRFNTNDSSDGLRGIDWYACGY